MYLSKSSFVLGMSQHVNNHLFFLMKFSRSHFSMLIKYIGVSFITGAISHGFFSGTRSLITGIFGIACFIVGTLIEENTSNTWKTIIAGAVLAVGIGSVTGGLQHFPDSPERSLYIIPVGYVISVILFANIHNYTLTKKEYKYIIISSIITLLTTVAIYALLKSQETIKPIQIPHSTTSSSATSSNAATIEPESVPGHSH